MKVEIDQHGFTARRYNVWAGNPDGVPEDPTRCIAEVYRDWRFVQCSRRRGHGPNGLWCKQHSRGATEDTDG